MTVADFEAHRTHLQAVAYRMLGSAADAEDVVQAAWLRWREAAPGDLRSPRGWLTTVVTRLCLDRLRSARATRERYVGDWLPEPVRTEAPVDVASISMAFLVVLERLSPMERAVFLLHEVFDHPYGEIAEVVGRSEVSCRQLCHRAKARVRAEGPRFQPAREAHTRLVEAFVAAVTAGDVSTLESLLARDATLCGDGGGKAPALRAPLEGAPAIARFFARLGAQLVASTARRLEIAEVNGWPAVVVWAQGAVEAVVTLETDGRQVVALRNVLNPEKLALPRVS